MRKRYVVLAASAILIGLAASGQPDRAAGARMRAELAATEGHYAAKQAVRLMLKAPVSTRFEPLMTVRGTICGYVNARNSFGGYTGAKEFMVFGGLTMLNAGTKSFAREWNRRCV
jgi:hypothetical protein